MRLLVLGGTVFLSRAVAALGVARGHEVVAVHRGRSGTVPGGVRQVVHDRAEPLPAGLAAERFDAVVDVARTPSHVRRAVEAWPDAHRVLVSTISVYADPADPGGPGVGRLVDPEPDDVDLAAHADAYGAMKVACERLVLDGCASAAVVRPGLVVGPGDPSGRFSYWPARMQRVLDAGPDEAAAADVLAPGDPSAIVQVVDVRDLAAWVLDLAERRTAGVYDAVGHTVPIADLLAAVARGCGAVPRWRWVDDERLSALDVRPWAGPRSLPLWLPRPAYDGMLAHDPGPALAAGLSVRPVEETAADVLDRWRADPDAPVTGLTAAEEAEVLARVPGLGDTGGRSG
ncbi:NAD-dependent epimerase/dehydratase family protein [Isoptericola haloaureus]|uniref:NAD-dependent epimerase/dehydratase family protein n=1 Tax=Isoptericola haloaureus TaxID=1542902 RepID=A0ABU7ZBB4_9MICO